MKVCLSFPRLILPNNMRGRIAVVSKVFQNIGSFRKGMFKELWNMPNVSLGYGSFNQVKRAEALARAGELGAAVRALTSEGVLDAKEYIQKLQELHPQEGPPMMPDLWTTCMMAPHSMHITLLLSQCK